MLDSRFRARRWIGLTLFNLSLASVAPLVAQTDRLDIEGQSIEPFKIFDNVYYIGTSWVSCYAVDTGEGLVLIDALYGDFPKLAMESLQKLGLGEEKVRYVLATHGHWDHAGGAAYFQNEIGAKVGMTPADWKLALESAKSGQARLFTGGVPHQDLTIKDGDVLEVGKIKFHCYVTPGHTEGVLSLSFGVKDGDREHRAFVFGGVGLNFRGVKRTQSYIDSVERIQSIARQSPRIEVSLSNHPGMAKILERQTKLANRHSSQPHPFVDHQGFMNDLSRFRANARKKLEDELVAAKSP